eukprot:gnl/TRDRNA2_/TRDRNA2_122460_c3_seq1.p1 gnl/TRDRNA2_/TRDRNA2_122460_c3~~gnl/TRDRNA2_/TRDRNA2_122460_c3_seq1.p1  ORF type:complete len:120 (+),score=31.79 gnl/TRDRNA2_/TRDRNA2_122460_c3_seq1:352-711(+)
MRKYDPDDAKDQGQFAAQITMLSQGLLNLQLKDIAEAVPQSALPLFVWVNDRVIEQWAESQIKDEKQTESHTAVDDAKASGGSWRSSKEVAGPLTAAGGSRRSLKEAGYTVSKQGVRRS